MSASQALVMDSEREELAKSSSKMEKKCELSDAKTAAALKSHSEAERRRRERINAHLSLLRGLVPVNDKMDKATLLAEVINHVKQMQKTANQTRDGFFIPLDSDEVRVEQIDKIPGEEASFRASICCDYRPGLLSDLRKAFVALNVSMIRSELSTLEGRLMIVIFFSANRMSDFRSTEDQEELMRSVHKALSSTVEKFNVSLDYSTQVTWPYKRRKVSSQLESSSSSS